MSRKNKRNRKNQAQRRNITPAKVKKTIDFKDLLALSTKLEPSRMIGIERNLRTPFTKIGLKRPERLKFARKPEMRIEPRKISKVGRMAISPYLRDGNKAYSEHKKRERICNQRRKRREILMATRKAGKGKSISKIKKLTEKSKVRC